MVIRKWCELPITNYYLPITALQAIHQKYRFQTNFSIGKQIYQLIPISPQNKQQVNDIRSQHPLDGVIAALLGFEIKEGDVIWADDRWINSHPHRGGIPIADIYDILKLLVGMGEMQKEEYYQILHKLRAGNVIFIPIERDEIVYHLKQAHIQNNHTIVETKQLKILRQYVVSCLQRKDILQIPPMPAGSPNEYGEKAFVITLTRAIGWAFFDIWTDEEIDEQNRPILCDWILNNLYLDNLALSRSTLLHGEDIDEEFQAAIGLVLLISAPFNTGYSDLKNVSRGNYFSWLYERVLHKRFIADPQLLPIIVESLKRTFREVKVEHTQQDVQASLGIDWLLQTFYDDLPKSIQEELRRDEDFMVSFGLKFTQLISIDGLTFESGTFFEAAQKAINGHKSVISPVQDEIEIVFEPIENELALSFIHPVTGDEVRVKDECFILLIDSPSEQEKMLYKQRHWFDCSEADLKKAIASIVITSDTLRRVELAEEWREFSPSIYYGDLYHQMQEQKRFDFPNLIPPSTERLLTFYRLSPKAGTGQAFNVALTDASEALLREEGLKTTISRLVGFPNPLPPLILNAIDALPESEISNLIRNLIRMAGSPLSKIHFLNILVHLGNQNASYYRLY